MSRVATLAAGTLAAAGSYAAHRVLTPCQTDFLADALRSIHADDMGMADLREQSRFVQCTAAVVARDRISRTNDLERDFDVQVRVDRAVYRPE